MMKLKLTPAKIFTVVFGLTTIIAGIFFVITLNEKMHYENDKDEIISNETTVAVKQMADDNVKKFAEEAKKPFKHYISPVAQASVEFDYPKTWSGYLDANTISNSANKSDVDFAIYFDSSTVRPTGDLKQHALSIKIVPTRYEETLATFRKNIDDGSLKASSYTIKGHENDGDGEYSGILLQGTLEEGSSGNLVVLRTRDRTLLIRNDDENYMDDFENIILPSLRFIP